jgi:hypothetical protein
MFSAKKSKVDFQSIKSNLPILGVEKIFNKFKND